MYNTVSIANSNLNRRKEAQQRSQIGFSAQGADLVALEVEPRR